MVMSDYLLLYLMLTSLLYVYLLLIKTNSKLSITWYDVVMYLKEINVHGDARLSLT